MKLQKYQVIDEKIREDFEKMKKERPECFKKRLNLSWSNWGFGMENLEDTAKRLAKAGIKYIELAGNHLGPDVGYKVDQTLKILNDNALKCAGICGLFSDDNALSSNRALVRQAAIDYLRREVEFAKAVGGVYVLVVPGRVGISDSYDESDYERSVQTLKLVADVFVKYGIKAAVEPIRSAEVAIVHTIKEAKNFLEDVGHPGVQHINGDIFHMLSEESHIGEAILDAGEKLINIHLEDSNRRALGYGCMDIDSVIRSLYLIGHNSDGRFVTPEPLGPGGNSYKTMYGQHNKADLDKMVFDTVSYFREREEELLA
jgi:D-psicose/D-tagatose/L-ribulose 3-epimerase